MLEIYWGCLIGGLAFGLISVVFGDFLGDAFDGLFDAISVDGFEMLHPMTLIGGITLFGALGLMLTKYSSLEVLPAGLISGAAAIAFSDSCFLCVRKTNEEHRVLDRVLSIKELVGRTAEVTIPIPEGGYGEVLVKLGAQHTYQIAAAHNNEMSAKLETTVVVVEEKGRYTVRYRSGYLRSIPDNWEENNAGFCAA